MAYFQLPYMHQQYIETVRDSLIESDAVLLLILEVIDYSLRYHNLPNWVPTWNLDFLRMNNEVTYFNENFAVTVINPNTESQAVQQGNRFGFDLTKWLDSHNHEEARNSLEYFLSQIFIQTNPSLFEMFSFACYVSRMAVQRNRNNLVNDVVWGLLLTLRRIIPYEHYYSGFHFVANMYHPPIGNQLSNDDEGIQDMATIDISSRANDRGWIYTDPILSFVRDLIDYYLSYNNFAGAIPSSNLPDNHMDETRYFNETLQRAITHNCLEEDAIFAAHERGFTEERWLQIYRPLVAINFQMHVLGQIFNFNQANILWMLCFACYSSKIAMRNSRTSLIDAVVGAVADFLRRYFPYPQFYTNLTNMAVEYNSHHQYLHLQSDDEGVGNEENEESSSDENNRNESSEESAASQTDNEGNEAEGNDAQPLLVGNEENDAQSSLVEKEAEEGNDGQSSLVEREAKEGNGQSSLVENEAEERNDARPSLVENESEERNDARPSLIEKAEERSWDQSSVLENDAKQKLDASEWLRTDASKARGEMYTLNKSGSDASVEDNVSSSSEENIEVNALEGGSGMHALEGGSGMHALEEGSGMHALEEGSGMHALEEGSGMHALERGRSE